MDREQILHATAMAFKQNRKSLTRVETTALCGSSSLVDKSSETAFLRASALASFASSP